MAQNTFKKPKKEKQQKVKDAKPGMLHSLLNGSFLTRDKSADLLPFVVFLASLAVMLIANTYYAEKKSRQIEQMRQEVTEMRTMYISNKAELMHLSNQSEIARRLHVDGFVESTVPPRMLYKRNERKNILLRISGKN